MGLTLLAGVATQAYAQTVPTVSFATGSHTAFEGSGTHNVALTLNPAPTSDITVKYRIQNKATSLYPYATLGSDFTIATPGTVTVPKGATTATIPVTIIDDTEGEWEERIYLWLMEGTGYRFNPWHWRTGVSVHTLTIAANDTPPPLVSITKKSQTLGEGSGTHNVNLTLNPAPTSDITVKYELSPPHLGRVDRTTPGSDYETLSGTLSVPRGATTATIPVTIVDDDEQEGEEAFAVQLVRGNGYWVNGSSWRQVLTIVDNEPYSKVGFVGGRQSIITGLHRVHESAGTYDVTVSVSPAPASDLTVYYGVGSVPGSATSGSDYEALPRPLTVPKGATTAIIPVKIIDDGVRENDEIIVLGLVAGGTGWDLVYQRQRFTLTIVDSGEVPQPTMSFATESHTAGEGAGTHDVEVTLNPAPTSDITLAYTVGGTATPGSDFTIANSGTLSVPKGAATATIPVTIIDDSAQEGDETVVLTLNGSAGYGVGNPATHTLTIRDDDAPTVSFATGSHTAFEGAGTHDVEVTLNKAQTSDITVKYTVGGTAMSGSDFTIASSGTLSVPRGTTTATIPVTIIDDSVKEDNETVVLTLIDGAGYSVDGSTHTLTIADNEGPSAVSFASGTYRASEGDDLQPELLLSHPRSEDVTVMVETLDLGGARSGEDFAAGPFRVTVPAGKARHRFSIETFVDDEVEQAEEVLLHISPYGHSPGVYRSSSGTPDAVAVIRGDNVPPPTVYFLRPRGRAGESSGTRDVYVKLSPAPASAITLHYTVGGTATPDADYTALSGTRSVPADAELATIPVAVIDDAHEDSGETVVLTLVGGTGYTVGGQSKHTLVILNHDQDDLEGLVQARIDAAAANGDAASGNLWRRALAAVRGEAPPSGLAPLTEAEAQAQADAETAGGNAALAALWTDIAHIVGAATPPTPTVPEVAIAAGADATEGGDATFTVTATPAPTSSLTVGVTVTEAGGYATAGTRQVTIPPGGSATLTVATASDDTDAPDGTVTATLAAGTDYTVSATSGSATVAVTDDDATAVTLTVPDPVATEGDADDTASIALTLNRGLVGGESLAVPLQLAGGAVGTDFTLLAPSPLPAGVTFSGSTVTFAGPASGQSAASVTLTLGALVDADTAERTVTVSIPASSTGSAPTLTATGLGGGASGARTGDGRMTLSDAPPVVTPEVSISGGGGVTEGGDARFTVTAAPAPDEPLAVSVTVSTDGDFGITHGSRTVTLPTAGSAVLTLATTDDTTDEAHGTVTATLAAGAGYTVSATAGAATVAVADDDAPPATPAVDPALIAEVKGHIAHFTARSHGAGIRDWGLVLDRLEGRTGMSDAAIAAWLARSRLHGWQDGIVTLPKVQAALAALEAVPEPEQQPVTLPAVTVAAGASPVTEGGDATFTFTANPTPTADLSVSVTVAAAGDYGIAGESRTVTLPTAGSVTLTLATTDDTTDEPHGSVTVTVTDGDGYTVGAPASGTVSIEDDDLPPPAVTITANAAAVTEGAPAAFTVTADRAPGTDLAVTLEVADAPGGDFVAGGDEGERTVTIASGETSAVFTLTTTDDTTDEPDGAVTVTVTDGDGYTVGAPASGTVSIEDDDLPPPVVTVTANATAVTEGGDATFTVTASRAPGTDLAVTLEVADAPGGDFVAGGDEGARTVTIANGETSVVFTLATTDDTTDEPDGAVTVTVTDGDGYTVGAPASGTVSIEDDDLPPPEVSIAADAASITEGAPAAFTLSADRVPDADLTITLAVSEAAHGDHVAADDEGAQTVTIAKGATEAVFSVATVNDTTDEPDGTVTVTLNDGAGYTVSPSRGAATVAVSDDDTSAGPVLSVADATVREGEGLMWFTVRLSAPSQRAVKVSYRTRESTPVSAQANVDYLASSWGIDFRAGETEKQVYIYIYDDSHDEGAETFEVVLWRASGAPIGDGVGVGTIVNDDPMPAAWLGRFGRTVAEQALDGIAGRMAASRTPGMQGTLAGQALTFDAPAHGDAGPGHAPGGNGSGAAVPGGTGALAFADIARGFDGHGAVGNAGRFGDAGVGHGPESGPGQAFGGTQSHTMTAREALLGSSFTLTGATDGSGGSMAFWGRGSQARFDGREGTFSLDGGVTTALLGVDYARDEWLIGLALAQSTGEGEYRDTEAAPRPASQTCPEGMDAATRALCNGAVREGDGEVEASLTAAIPYASLQASERLKLWGAAGIGSGEVTLKTAMGGSYSADTTWRMAAAGLRGDLLAPPAEGSGPALALTSDALWTRTSSEKTRDLAASESDATRLRLGLEGSYRMALEGGGHLTPKLEVGARHDGGDAETGFGIELGGGIAWADPALGLSLDLSGRTLLSHEDDDLKDRGYAASLAFDPSPASERGPSFSLRQEFGARARGGLDALFAPDPLDERPGGELTSRWTAEAAYGFPAFGGRFTASPHVGLGLSAAARDYSLGWRWTPAPSAPDLAFGFKATRRESDAASPEHTAGLEVRARW